MSHEPRRDDLLLYAAGALDGPEREALETHLRDGCPRCEAELSAAEAILVELALSPDPVEPAPEVRARLIARAQRSARAQAPLDLPARPTATWPRRALAAGVAALVAGGLGAALVDGFVAAPLRDRMRSSEERLRATAEELREIAAEREDLRSQLAEQDAELAALEEAADADQELIRFLRTPGVQSVALTPTARQPQASGRVFWEWEDYACHLHAKGLLPPGPERVYALWLHIEDGGVVKVGTFLPGAEGDGTLFARLPRDVGRVVRTTVTEEASQVGEEPNGEIQLAAAVVDPRR